VAHLLEIALSTLKPFGNAAEPLRLTAHALATRTK